MKALAIDIGAESGRAILGNIDGGRLVLREVHRFPNIPIRIGQTLRWDLDALLRGVFDSIDRAGEDLTSVGVDTWGVDFVLLDRFGEPIEAPYHYRDSRTDGIMERAFAVVPREEIYEATGIQFLPFNSLYQLYSMALSNSEVLKSASLLLTIPDYLTYVLAGSNVAAARCEFTNATTTQCLNPRTSAWAEELLLRLGIPARIFPDLVMPGTVIGNMPGKSTTVVAPACHDTGSAVAAVPAEDADHSWISSGTWSIMGILTPSPIINSETCKASFTNEGGVDGTFRFSKNVMGLWILQQCRAQWESEGQASDYGELAKQAEAVGPNLGIFDPDDPTFFKPGNMPARIGKWLRDRDLPAPETAAETTRVVLDSLANKYSVVFDQLQSLSGRKLSRIHMFGGGSKNQLLNRLTSEACGVPVVAGPVEATAIGNLLVQMRAMGELGTSAEAKKLQVLDLTSSDAKPTNSS